MKLSFFFNYLFLYLLNSIHVNAIPGTPLLMHINLYAACLIGPSSLTSCCSLFDLQ